MSVLRTIRQNGGLFFVNYPVERKLLEIDSDILIFRLDTLYNKKEAVAVKFIGYMTICP